jgi:transcriptional regulator with XRE-family HTH domain
LSQQQVAERIGIEPETVSRIETGVIAPTLIRLRQFAKVYGCSLQGLLGRTSDTLPDLAQRIAVELNPLPPTDQRHVAEQAVATARYLQALRRDGS